MGIVCGLGWGKRTREIVGERDRDRQTERERQTDRDREGGGGREGGGVAVVVGTWERKREGGGGGAFAYVVFDGCM